MNKQVVGERMALVARIAPGSASTGDTSTPWVSAADYGRLAGLISAGTLGASATLDAKLEQATDNSGTGAKDISGKAITQLVKASNDDDEAFIEVRADELDTENDFTHVRLTLTVGTAASDVAAYLFGFDPRYTPTNVASVQEVVQ